jgi:hypothetical protein
MGFCTPLTWKWVLSFFNKVFIILNFRKGVHLQWSRGHYPIINPCSCSNFRTLVSKLSRDWAYLFSEASRTSSSGPIIIIGDQRVSAQQENLHVLLLAPLLPFGLFAASCRHPRSVFLNRQILHTLICLLERLLWMASYKDHRDYYLRHHVPYTRRVRVVFDYCAFIQFCAVAPASVTMAQRE